MKLTRLTGKHQWTQSQEQPTITTRRPKQPVDIKTQPGEQRGSAPSRARETGDLRERESTRARGTGELTFAWPPGSEKY
eukprot:g23624.t1